MDSFSKSNHGQGETFVTLKLRNEMKEHQTYTKSRSMLEYVKPVMIFGIINLKFSQI